MFHPHITPTLTPTHTKNTQSLTKCKYSGTPLQGHLTIKDTSSGPLVPVLDAHSHSHSHTHTQSQESPSRGVGTQSRVKDGGSDLQREVWTGWHYDAD